VRGIACIRVCAPLASLVALAPGRVCLAARPAQLFLGIDTLVLAALEFALRFLNLLLDRVDASTGDVCAAAQTDNSAVANAMSAPLKPQVLPEMKFPILYFFVFLE